MDCCTSSHPAATTVVFLSHQQAIRFSCKCSYSSIIKLFFIWQNKACGVIALGAATKLSLYMCSLFFSHSFLQFYFSFFFVLFFFDSVSLLFPSRLFFLTEICRLTIPTFNHTLYSLTISSISRTQRKILKFCSVLVCDTSKFPN